MTSFALATMALIYNAHADQNDPRLIHLFADLQTPLTSAAAQEIEEKIWSHWGTFPDDKTVENTMNMAVLLMERGELRLAEQIFSRIIDRAPDFAEAWNKRATARFLMGNHKGSAEDIAEVLRLEPRHFGALSGLGMIYMNSGDWRGALNSYKAALAINPYLTNIKLLIDSLKQRLKGQAL